MTNIIKTSKISEKIGMEEISKWRKGELITINAGTGAGKSHFIKNDLYHHCKFTDKKILFLIHRRNCVEQFQKEIEAENKTDIITIKSYQKLEFKQLKEYENNFDDYDYIVCDEYHYFFSDSDFSNTTDISLNLILSETNAVKIFLSATGELVKRYVNNYKKIDTTDYCFDIKYDFINQLAFFSDDKYIEELVQEKIKNGGKAIVFLNDVEKAYNLHKKYKAYTLFNCSKTQNYYSNVDTTKISEMLENCKFEESVLITTSVMEAGVNIKDDELDTIVVSKIYDVDVIKQSLGRKRLNKDEKFNVFIQAPSNKTIGGLTSETKSKIAMADCLRNNDVETLISKYPRQYDKSNIIYDVKLKDKDKATKKVNEMMYFKCKINLKNYKEMIDYRGNFGFIKYVEKRLSRQADYTFIYDSLVEGTLEEYLNMLVGKKLYKEEQKELINRVDYRFDGKQYKTAKKLNEAFVNEDLNYAITTKRDKRKKLENGTDNPNRDKTYWEIIKIEE